MPASVNVVNTIFVLLGSNDNGHEPNEVRLLSNQKTECYDCCRRLKATLSLLRTSESVVFWCVPIPNFGSILS
ncbi:unnamed protein product [Lathyrus sativus]|nr:unnamed protein product [Lathyrus sativus]